MQQYNDLCLELSTIVTHRYSTSFTRGIKTLNKRFHKPIYAVYGYVRLADEIVDSFHDFNKKELLEEFKKNTWEAIDNKISTNPILHAFQLIVNEYQIDRELIVSFLYSMELDLEKKSYDEAFYEKYIYGSAEVVGLMCLRIFCEGNNELYNKLIEPAQRLGAAFQKVNFLRDLKADFKELGRVYFPGIDFKTFDNAVKKQIEKDIDADFKAAYPGLMQLPKDVRPGVYTAFIYYRELLSKIEKVPASEVMNTRIRVPDAEKMVLLLRTYTKFGFSIF
ncbi:MAG: phytoene/squalene synthase family protein [Bacteroidetes bacterium]|nr:phytoene/squalene synthase family protein [Bacteroidota bacterium]MBK8413340.1 phytoene/squalene synthase family protein [Bacteroidota bacterium]MBK9046261.1 phytoene/squalene synthase family protein [Bacteroidota bacterium]MBK9424847.1 phytoene/squalene synthase family protein [Bacteroidota bacterium]